MREKMLLRISSFHLLILWKCRSGLNGTEGFFLQKVSGVLVLFCLICAHQLLPVVQRPGHEDGYPGGGGEGVQPLGAPHGDGGAAPVPAHAGARRQVGAQQQDAALVVRDVGPAEQVREEAVQLGVLGLVVGMVGLEKQGENICSPLRLFRRKCFYQRCKKEVGSRAQ